MMQSLHRRAALLSLFLITSCTVSAQTLEEVNFSPSSMTLNTYLTDINNRGFICGYYDSAGTSHGFVINPDGKIRRFIAASGSSIKAEGINDRNTVLLSVTTGGNTLPYKANYDTVSGTYGPTMAVSVGQTSAIPFGINNNNDVIGWYQGASERYAWVSHDSVVPASSTSWVANRYFTSGPSTWYNTQGTGINDNNMGLAFYINGNTINPLIYNGVSGTFTPITNVPSTRTKLHDINNNQIAVGEYQMANGTYMAFWAPVASAGNITQNHSLVSAFATVSPPIQAVANGINDKGDIVGSYLHPGTNSWVGFIYRPNMNEYRLPGYDWNLHTWKMKNTQYPSNQQAVWTSSYWGGFNYGSSDPYASNGKPLVDALIKAKYPTLQNPAWINPLVADWKSFAEEIDTFHVGTTPSQALKYNTIWKYWAFDKWFGNNNGKYLDTFGGICYGFAFTSLLRYYNDTPLHNWFGLPYNATLSAYNNTDATAIRAITRTFIKQNDQSVMSPYWPSHYADISMWSGMYRLKNCYGDPVAKRRNPRAIYLKLNTGYHSVLPYKIRTPKQFPFNYNGVDAPDTLFIYDSNEPMDSNQYFTCKTYFLDFNLTSAKSPKYGNGLKWLSFAEAGVQEMLPIEHARLKGTSLGDEAYASLRIGPAAYYNLSGAGSTVAVYDATGFSGNIPYLQPGEQKDVNVLRPRFLSLDTGQSVKVSAYAYPDSAMSWNISSRHRSMGLSRSALPGQTDNGTIGYHLMTYGTHDNVAKDLAGYLVEMNDDISQGVNLVATGITMNAGDSILTANPAPYQYKITRYSNTPDNYDLWLYAASGDSVHQFKSTNIPIAGNTTHIVDPYFPVPGGTKVAVLVDNNNNGSWDDTLFVTQVTTAVTEGLPHAGFVTVYPNPAQRQVTVSFAGSADADYTLSLTDVTGRTLQQQAVRQQGGPVQAVLTMSAYPAGTYYIRVQDEQGRPIHLEKVVKE